MPVLRRIALAGALVILVVAPARAVADVARSSSDGHRSGPDPAGHHRGRSHVEAHRSLRAPVTDQSFYFVMADRFKDTDANRFFVPLATPEIWLRQGDGRIYSCAAANDTCVVPSA
jgi:hypothetical protein